ncbi:MAG: ATP-binding cassette domain-containing protein [Proteobacteria bacterium]|nr:ATP-binding cassette domain-containing protein [Pseudomonadota bacterium]
MVLSAKTRHEGIYGMTRDGKLRLRDVTVALDGQPLIAGLSLVVAPGEVVTVMGASGSGKSTLLSWICGSVDPVFAITGHVLLDGQDITRTAPEARRVGILFQDDLLFPHLSVGENLAFGIPRGVGRDDRRARVADALAEAELSGFEDRDPATLSGGQRARVALMRTLMAEPKALLLDEPFSKLDAALRDRIRRFTFDHATERGLPTLLVTHDPDDAAAAAGPIIDIDIAPC